MTHQKKLLAGALTGIFALSAAIGVAAQQQPQKPTPEQTAIDAVQNSKALQAQAIAGCPSHLDYPAKFKAIDTFMNDDSSHQVLVVEDVPSAFYSPACSFKVMVRVEHGLTKAGTPAYTARGAKVIDLPYLPPSTPMP